MRLNNGHFSRKKAEISAKTAEKTAEILIYDQIGKDWFGDGISAAEFTKDLSKIDAENLVIRINSPGGSVFEGIAIYNALKRFDGLIEVHIDALAASAASFIAMAGDEIIMSDGAFIMIHDPWSAVMGFAEDMRKEADLLDQIQGEIASIYAKRTKTGLDKIKQLMADETWMTAEQAVELGFADRAEEGKSAKAKVFDLSMYTKVPDTIKARFQQPIPTKRDIERTLTRDAGLSRSQAITLLGDGYDALSDTRDAGGEGETVLHHEQFTRTVDAAISTLLN